MSPGPTLVVDKEGRGPTCGSRGGVTKEGLPCETFRNLGEESGRCMWHDPERVKERALLTGAQNSAKVQKAELAKEPAEPPPYAPDTLEALSLWHQWAADAVATGRLGVRAADSICRHLRELRPTLQALGMERRLKELEAELKATKKELAVRKRRRDA